MSSLCMGISPYAYITCISFAIKYQARQLPLLLPTPILSVFKVKAYLTLYVQFKLLDCHILIVETFIRAYPNLQVFRDGIWKRLTEPREVWWIAARALISSTLLSVP